MSMKSALLGKPRLRFTRAGWVRVFRVFAGTLNIRTGVINDRAVQEILLGPLPTAREAYALGEPEGTLTRVDMKIPLYGARYGKSPLSDRFAAGMRAAAAAGSAAA
jgi:hypothetical protein